MHPVDAARRARGEHVRACGARIDGPVVNRAGIVAWRRYCRNRTTRKDGRCRFHPYEGLGCLVGETAEMHRHHVEREGT